MATPNINDSSKNITGFTTGIALNSTNPILILDNAASSGKLLKVNSIYVANIDGTSNYDITIAYYTQENIGGTSYKIASTVVVPADATVIVVSKDAPIYLREDSSLGAIASAADVLDIVVSYEEIS